MKSFGGQNMYHTLRRVIVRRPDEAFGNADPEKWHYTARPALSEAQSEHDALVKILDNHGAEVIYHDENLPDLADSIYVFDPVLITDHGAIILKMGKQLRRGEEAGISHVLGKNDIPILKQPLFSLFKNLQHIRMS